MKAHLARSAPKVQLALKALQECQEKKALQVLLVQQAQ